MEVEKSIQYLGTGYIFDVSGLYNYLYNKLTVKPNDIAVVKRDIRLLIIYVLQNNGYQIQNDIVHEDEVLFINNKYVINGSFLDIVYRHISVFFQKVPASIVTVEYEDNYLVITFMLEQGD